MLTDATVAIDLTVFVESLPRKQAYLLTALALWWGVGNAVGSLIGEYAHVAALIGTC